MFFVKLCEEKVFVNITIVSGPMACRDMKIQTVKQKVAHKTCKDNIDNTVNPLELF